MAMWESAAWKDPTGTDGDRGSGITNRRIRIWWDGDQTYYEARVVDFSDGLHQVVYLGDTAVYSEDLTSGSQVWQLCCDEALADREAEERGKLDEEVEARSTSESASAAPASAGAPGQSGSSGRNTYSAMVKAAVAALGDPKTGCTLPAIRKKIADDNPDTASKAKASFNNLTLKAISKLVSEGILLKMKSSFKFNPQYLKEEEMRAQRRLSKTSALGLQIKQGERSSSSKESSFARFERNKQVRAELEASRTRRNAALKAHQSSIMPFLPEGDHFFARLERETLLEALSGGGGGNAKNAAGSGTHSTRPSAMSSEFNPSDNIEFRSLPVTDESILETLTRLGLIKRELVAPHLPPVTLQGRLCTECPPLQLDSEGWPIMEDAAALDMMIEQQGPFQGYRVVWPGMMLPFSDLRELSPNPAAANGSSFQASWQHVYYLEKMDSGGTVVKRTTAMRLNTGVFETHRTTFMKRTQSFAKRINVPILNLFTFQCRDPQSGQPRHITRQFCAETWFGTIYKRLVRDTLRRSPSLMSVIAELVPSAMKPEKEKPQVNFPAGPPSSTLHKLAPEAQSSALHGAEVEGKGIGAAKELMSPSELEKLSPKRKEDLAASAAEWAAKAHAPPPESVMSQGVQAVVQHYTDLLAAASGLPVQGVLLSTVDARLQHALKALSNADLEAPKQISAAEAASKVDLTAGVGEVRVPAPCDELAHVTEAELYNPADVLKDIPRIERPPSIRAALHDHQVEGLSWLAHMYKNGMPMILGDQMGLGKAICLIAYLRDCLGVPGPHLVVVPLSVLSNWMTEIERFCPNLRAVRFHGPRDERTRIKMEELRDMAEFDVVVTTYEMLAAESNFFRRSYLWRLVIVDEGHRLKNDKSQLAQKLKQVPAYSRILLTGTPLQNNLRELWALLHFLLPDVFTSACAAKFEAGFDLGRGICDREVLRAARRLLSVIMLRRIKDQVNIPLPPRTEIQILVKLTPIQHAFYKHLLVSQDKSMLDAIMGTAAGGSVKQHGAGEEDSPRLLQDADYRQLLNLLLQLRKVCNHPFLLAEFQSTEGGEDALVRSCGKLMLLERMLPLLKEDGHRVLIFTQFTSMMDLLEEFMSGKGYEYVRLDGETNRVQRRLDIRRFNQPGSPIFVFLISTRAGGLGINLASADTVIMYDSDWNPQADLQAMERAHRIGQTKPVRVYRLVCRGSVEERMVSRAEKKLFLNAMVAERQTAGDSAPDDSAEAAAASASTMSKQELASVIRFGASAVFEKDDDDLTDSDLDVLLGRVVEPGTVLDDGGVASSTVLLKKGARALEEVDLRELEGIDYAKKTPDHPELLQPGEDSTGIKLSAEDGVCIGKRQRKQRIVMVDGKGLGLHGQVAILADTLSDGDDESMIPRPGPGSAVAAAPMKKSRRVWGHEDVCILCSKGEGLSKCGHCPRALHLACMDAAGARYTHAGNFTCPQHRCVGCDRSTTAAGGLLFRCATCTSSFCEDCLPEEDVESIGRSPAMEHLGYYAKQAYWIRCETCCEGRTANEAEDDDEPNGDDDDEEDVDGEMDEEPPPGMPRL